jgi:HD-GYP domain-containing protein (c-di-GMP phosphodiesterase class II)
LEAVAEPSAEIREIGHKVTLASEVTRAAEICGRAKTAVAAMFAEARMGQAVDASQLEPLVDDIAGSVMRYPGALISLARLKTQDDYTDMHSVAVCGLMVALARQLGLNDADTRDAGFAGLLHDIGKATVDINVLNKPGKLTDA